MALFHQFVPNDAPKPKKGGDAHETPRGNRTKQPVERGTHNTPPEVSPAPASGVCPTCGQRIKPKTDRKAYQRDYQKRLRAKKRAEKQP